MNKGGGDEVSYIICYLFFRVPLRFPNLLQNLLGHSGKNDDTLSGLGPAIEIWHQHIAKAIDNVFTCYY